MTCDSASLVVSVILKEIADGIRLVPTEFFLKYLSKVTGVSPQQIGSYFDPHIKRPLENMGFNAIKSGNPVRIRVSKN